MALEEEQLARWTRPSSDTEQEKQARAERMIREAVSSHSAFADCDLRIFAKGSYANNTNVRSDSDVDIAVQCTECEYWEEASAGAHPTSSADYVGVWTPSRLRNELRIALENKFAGQVDSSGSVALRVAYGSARVDADVVPCFTYKYFFTPTNYLAGTKIFRVDGRSLENYPRQQLDNGVTKNNRASRSYKSTVRILKRTENALAAAGLHKALPSYFIECLAYNCPDALFRLPTWTDTIRSVLIHIYGELEGSEPINSDNRWLEVNECKFLFHNEQPWGRSDGRSFALAAWQYLGFTS